MPDLCAKCGKPLGEEPAWIYIGKKYCNACFRAVQEEAARLVREREENKKQPPAAPEQAGLCRLGDLLPGLRKTANTEPVYGAALLKRIGEYKDAWHALSKEGTPAERDRINTAWKSLVGAMNVTPLIVPFSYGDDAPGTEDRALHCTAAAAARLNTDAIVYRTDRMTPAQIAPLLWTRGADGTLGVDYDWWDISRFSGSEGWHFHTGDAGGPMYIHRARVAGDQYLGVYTGIGSMLSMFPSSPCPHAAVITAGDLVNFILRDAALKGIILEANTENHCMIPRAYIQPQR